MCTSDHKVSEPVRRQTGPNCLIKDQINLKTSSKKETVSCGFAVRPSLTVGTDISSWRKFLLSLNAASALAVRTFILIADSILDYSWEQKGADPGPPDPRSWAVGGASWQGQGV